eukprot:TRINITY_DN152_c1_g1_i7.p3 TRINITY_DN152_c1_g1~~TRINITY_DN152_c1_g1_i7.p3  ORF type:complete len:198 (-),score=-21.06 TRINITY_DN152_c1_g1_i7:982-1575(-)
MYVNLAIVLFFSSAIFVRYDRTSVIIQNNIMNEVIMFVFTIDINICNCVMILIFKIIYLRLLKTNIKRVRIFTTSEILILNMCFIWVYMYNVDVYFYSMLSSRQKIFSRFCYNELIMSFLQVTKLAFKMFKVLACQYTSSCYQSSEFALTQYKVRNIYSHFSCSKYELAFQQSIRSLKLLSQCYLYFIHDKLVMNSL